MNWEESEAAVEKSKQKRSAYLLMVFFANHADGNGYSRYGVRRLALESASAETPATVEVAVEGVETSNATLSAGRGGRS
jgi:hypothetical protein